MKRIVLAALGFIAVTVTANAQAPTADDIARRSIERRAVEAAIWGMPAVNYHLMYQEMVTKTKGGFNQVLYWSRLLDWKNQTLTPNPDVIYLMPFFNTKDVGPVVLEIPPADEGLFNGSVMNYWQAAIEDVGPGGVDKGKGGKYLILPPGYDTDQATRRLHRHAIGHLSGLCLDTLGARRAAARPISPRPSPTPGASSSTRSRRRPIRRRRSSSTRAMSCSIPPFPTTCASSRRSTGWCRPSRGSNATRR